MSTVQTLHILHITLYAMAFIIYDACVCAFIHYNIHVNGAEHISLIHFPT